MPHAKSKSKVQRDAKGQPQPVTTGFKPRPLQSNLLADEHRFKVLVCHRRFGKTVFCVNELVAAAAYSDIELPGLPAPRFGYLAPYYSQAKDIAWEYLKHYAGPIPGVTFHEGELRADFAHGARIRLYGAENADRLRGVYFDGVVLDEYAKMNPRVWPEVVRPALADRQGWAIFPGTPLGRNGFADLYEGAVHGFQQPDGAKRVDPDWRGFLFKASETGIIPQDELEAARRAMTPDQYAQEFECSFDAAIPGTYYAPMIAEIERQGRIKPVHHEPALPVHTAWDLGINDPTVIWFFQMAHDEVRVIDFYEMSGPSIEYHIAQLRADHRSSWVYGVHLFPHDAAAKSLQTGMTTVDVLKRLGVHVTVLPATSVDDGISQGRFALRKAWFNSERCGDGLKALRQYRSEWDERRQVLKPTPLHDWTSHAADAWRYLAVGVARHALGRQPLSDTSMSSIARAAGGRPRFANGGGQKPWGW